MGKGSLKYFDNVTPPLLIVEVFSHDSYHIVVEYMVEPLTSYYCGKGISKLISLNSYDKG